MNIELLPMQPAGKLYNFQFVAPLLSETPSARMAKGVFAMHGINAKENRDFPPSQLPFGLILDIKNFPPSK